MPPIAPMPPAPPPIGDRLAEILRELTPVAWNTKGARLIAWDPKTPGSEVLYLQGRPEVRWSCYAVDAFVFPASAAWNLTVHESSLRRAQGVMLLTPQGDLAEGSAKATPARIYDTRDLYTWGTDTCDAGSWRCRGCNQSSTAPQSESEGPAIPHPDRCPVGLLEAAYYRVQFEGTQRRTGTAHPFEQYVRTGNSIPELIENVREMMARRPPGEGLDYETLHLTVCLPHWVPSKPERDEFATLLRARMQPPPPPPAPDPEQERLLLAERSLLRSLERNLGATDLLRARNDIRERYREVREARKARSGWFTLELEINGKITSPDWRPMNIELLSTAAAEAGDEAETLTRALSIPTLRPVTRALLVRFAPDSTVRERWLRKDGGWLPCDSEGTPTP